MSTRIKELLNAQHQWPCEFMFKFVVPVAKVSEVQSLFKELNFVERPSSGGKYVSMTLVTQMNSSEEVLAIYEKASQVEGLIAL